MAGVGRELRVSVLAVRAQEPRRYYLQVTIAGPAGAPLPPPPGSGADGPGAAAAPSTATPGSALIPLRPDTVARTETAQLARCPEFANRTFVMRLPQPLGASLHSRAIVQVSLFAAPSVDAPPGPLLAGRESDDLIGRGYVEMRGEIASRLLRGERVTLPVALLDLGCDAALAFAGTGAMRLRKPAGGCGGGGGGSRHKQGLGAARSGVGELSGATMQLLAARSSVVEDGVYGKSDLEALVELLLIDSAALDVVPLSLLTAAGGSGRALITAAGGRSARGADGQQSDAAADRALVRTPSSAVRELAECSLLVLVSAAEGLPLVKRCVFVTMLLVVIGGGCCWHRQVTRACCNPLVRNACNRPQFRGPLHRPQPLCRRKVPQRRGAAAARPGGDAGRGNHTGPCLVSCWCCCCCCCCCCSCCRCGLQTCRPYSEPTNAPSNLHIGVNCCASPTLRSTCVRSACCWP